MKKVRPRLPAIRRWKVSWPRMAMTMQRTTMAVYSASSSSTPIRPSSSEYTAKMKSVCASGRKSSLAWVPSSQPLPNRPPEPMAILLWVMW